MVTEPTLDDAADYRFDNLYRVNWIEKLPDYQYQCLHLPFYQICDTFASKIQAISLKKSRNIKIFYRYRRVMIQFNDLIYNSFVKYDFAINENELSDISKRGGGIDGFKFRQIIF